jgi:hypothetical protein
VARLYTAENADDIVEAALDAGDAIDSALAAPNKELTVYYWQKVFGPSFKVEHHELQLHRDRNQDLHADAREAPRSQSSCRPQTLQRLYGHITDERIGEFEAK